MKAAFALVHPFLALREWRPLPQARDREGGTPVPPAPPEPDDDRGEPEKEYPFWTCFIDNPRPKS